MQQKSCFVHSIQTEGIALSVTSENSDKRKRQIKNGVKALDVSLMSDKAKCGGHQWQ